MPLYLFAALYLFQRKKLGKRTVPLLTKPRLVVLVAAILSIRSEGCPRYSLKAQGDKVRKGSHPTMPIRSK